VRLTEPRREGEGGGKGEGLLTQPLADCWRCCCKTMCVPALHSSWLQSSLQVHRFFWERFTVCLCLFVYSFLTFTPRCSSAMLQMILC
jgi:hypothetical protein